MYSDEIYYSSVSMCDLLLLYRQGGLNIMNTINESYCKTNSCSIINTYFNFPSIPFTILKCLATATLTNENGRNICTSEIGAVDNTHYVHLE